MQLAELFLCMHTFTRRSNVKRKIKKYLEKKYYSTEYIRKKVLHQTDQQIREIDDQIQSEKESGLDDSEEQSEEGDLE